MENNRIYNFRKIKDPNVMELAAALAETAAEQDASLEGLRVAMDIVLESFDNAIQNSRPTMAGVRDQVIGMIQRDGEALREAKIKRL